MVTLHGRRRGLSYLLPLLILPYAPHAVTLRSSILTAGQRLKRTVDDFQRNDLDDLNSMSTPPKRRLRKHSFF